MTKRLVCYLAINGLKRLRLCEDLANWKSATNVLHTLDDHVHVCVCVCVHAMMVVLHQKKKITNRWMDSKNCGML